jgi:hypothetical protein
MSWYGCEDEQKVFQAAQSGELEAPLKDHVSRCTVCAEVMAVTRFLLEDMRPDAMEIRLPEPGVLWWKAQLRSQDSVLARATRPIDLVAKIGAATLGLTGIWFAWTPSPARHWIANLLHTAMLAHAGNPYWGELALAGGIGTLFCAAISSLFVLRS